MCVYIYVHVCVFARQCIHCVCACTHAYNVNMCGRARVRCNVCVYLCVSIYLSIYLSIYIYIYISIYLINLIYLNSWDDSLGASNKPNDSQNYRQKLSKSMIVAKLRGLKSLLNMNALDKKMARHLFKPLSRAAGVSKADSVSLWNFINGEGYCDIEKIVYRCAAP